MALTQQERASVALRLLESLDGDDAGYDPDDERLLDVVAERIRDRAAGKVALLDGATALSSIRETLNKRG